MRAIVINNSFIVDGSDEPMRKVATTLRPYSS